MPFNYVDDDANEDPSADFTGFFQLEAGFNVGDAVSANAELGFSDDGSVGLNKPTLLIK